MKWWNWFPAEASDWAGSYDTLFFFMLALSGIVAVAVISTAIGFMFRYHHRRRVHRAGTASFQRILEYSWIGIPLLLFIVVFLWAANLYADLFFPPPGAMPVYITGKQWMWKIQHANGRREYDELHVPAGRPVVLVLTSEDVIHSFSLPALRIKHDVVPGRYTRIWFQADKPGSYHLFCAEYCGVGHASMTGRLWVLPPDRFAAWLGEGETSSLAREGEALFRQHGCSGCHGANASVRAPSLEGIFGKPVALSNGTTVIADERYIRDSILLPRKEVVGGYEPIMPSFRGQLGEDEIIKLIAYVKSLSEAPPP
ncbi:MAG: cytochrome c oxidase subunit II [Thiohalomonadaceae bacterium]